MTFDSVMKTSIATGMLALTAACHSPTSSDLMVESEQPFADWCTAWQLSKCDLQPTNPIPEDIWRIGLEVVDEAVTSPSTLNFDRTVYDSPEVQNLITELGVDEALAIIGQLPWENLSKDGTEVILSSGAPSSLEINGLTISAEELATISTNFSGILRSFRNFYFCKWKRIRR